MLEPLSHQRWFPDDDPFAPHKDPSVAGTFSLSDNAVQRLKSMLESEPTGTMLRIRVLGGGCSGFQYSFAFDTACQDDDLTFSKDGVVVVIDGPSLNHMDGSELDYEQALIGAAFKIRNPKASSSCGCGTSFAL